MSLSLPRLPYTATITTVIFSALLSACGGGGGSSTITLKGVAATGAPLAADSVVSYSCSDGSTNNSGRTAADGSYTLTVPMGALPCVIRVQPTAGETLYSFTEGSSSPQTVNLTPLTTLVVDKAIRALAPASNVGTWFSNPSQWQEVDAGITTAKTQLGNALTTAGHTLPSPFEPFSTPFTATAGNPYDDLLESVLGANRESGTSLSTLADAFASDQSLPPPANNTSGSPATVNADLVGSYTLAFNEDDSPGCGSVCSFANGDTVNVTVGSDNTLIVDGKTLSNPYFRIIGGSPHTPEIIWLDGDIEYAMTNNDSGVFSEINVSNTLILSNGFPQFLGQIRAAQASGPALISAFEGSYTLSSQYSGSQVSWTGVTIGADGAITFTGTGPDISANQRVSITDYNSCCSNVQVLANYDINGDGQINNSYDFIRLYKNTSGDLVALEYQASGSGLQQQVGVRFDSSSVPAYTESDATLQGSAVAATLNGTLTEINIGSAAQSAHNNALTFLRLSGSELTVQISVKQSVQAGDTLDCTYNRNTDTLINVQMNNNTYSSREGGRCQITIDSVSYSGTNSILNMTGHFVAELYDYTRKVPLLITDGVFSYDNQP